MRKKNSILLAKATAGYLNFISGKSWDYKGPSLPETRRIFGITINKNYIPGLSQDITGISLLKHHGGWSLYNYKRQWCLSLFRHSGKLRLRKGRNPGAIFTKVMFENAPIIDAETWQAMGQPETIYSKDDVAAWEIDEYIYDVKKDNDLRPMKQTFGEKYEYIRDPDNNNPFYDGISPTSGVILNTDTSVGK